jgi:hypothetical protein
MSTTFTPARPSVVGIMLYASGLLIGKACRFSLGLVHNQKKGSLQKRPAPVLKPERVFTLEEIRSIPTVLRRAGVDQEEWYRTYVLEPEAQRLEEKRASDDEYFSAVFAEPDDDDKSFF